MVYPLLYQILVVVYFLLYQIRLVQESESFNTIGKPGQPQGIAPTICP